MPRVKGPPTVNTRLSLDRGEKLKAMARKRRVPVWRLADDLLGRQIDRAFEAEFRRPKSEG